MGMYLNIGNAGFRSTRKDLYVDKSEPICFYIKATPPKTCLTTWKLYRMHLILGQSKAEKLGTTGHRQRLMKL